MKSFRDAVVAWAGSGRGDEGARERAVGLVGEVGVRGVVLVEGPSDVGAVEAFAGRLGRDLVGEGICVLAMGGAMGVGRFAGFLGPDGLGLRLTGLCDERERDYFERGWTRAGVVGSRDYFVCAADLEDELIRALGVERVIEIVREEGDLRPLETFLRQPAQRERTPQQQLRRFFGTTKGRKIHYGGVLVRGLEGERVPGPLARLFEVL
ncbi:hypothetical protein GCM10019017_37790 [Streptomyces showdoensis]